MAETMTLATKDFSISVMIMIVLVVVVDNNYRKTITTSLAFLLVDFNSMVKHND